MSIFPGARELFLAMIECTYHPKSDAERLEIASEMLLGKADPISNKKRGRKRIKDQKILYRMGELVNAGMSYRAAARECVGEFPGHSFDSTVERLRKKFSANKAKYTSTTYEEMIDEQKRIKTRILKILQEDEELLPASIKNKNWPI